MDKNFRNAVWVVVYLLKLLRAIAVHLNLLMGPSFTTDVLQVKLKESWIPLALLFITLERLMMNISNLMHSLIGI